MGADKATKDLLLVENELMIALEVQDLIEEAGLARVTLAGNEATARALIDDLPGLAAVILDVRVTDGTTLGLAEELRGRQIPFAFATGYDSDSDLLAKFADVPLIAKPFDPKEMVSLVKRLLEGSVSTNPGVESPRTS